jgi:drug/metabolite transporter (DMT)-like permease
MSPWHRFSNPGIPAALGAAILFGAGTPFAKLLLDAASPWLLAGILYLGSGLGLAGWRLIRGTTSAPITKRDIGWLAGAVLSGGVLAPVLLMWGLTRIDASSASLLLNAEGVLTAFLAWFVFHENFDRRIALGMACIAAGAIVLAWPSSPAAQAPPHSVWPAIAIIGACLAWALDNNLTRNVSLTDATFVAMVKGLVAGVTNVSLAVALESFVFSPAVVLAGGVLGFLSYGVSLVLFVVALRHLGTARTGAYFSIAPFVGAIIAVAFLGEPIRLPVLAAALLMSIGVWLHVTERHAHEHHHEALEHEHEHEHDVHHQHVHEAPIAPGIRHRHRHRHEPMTHAHEHYPDAHHRHRH